MAAAVRCWPQLQELSVQLPAEPYIEGSRYVFSAAVGVLPGQLQRLDVGNRRCRVGAADAQACCRALARRALQPPQLVHLSALSMDYMTIGDEGACALADALAGMPQLLMLHAGYACIGAAGGTRLLSALSDHCPQLCQLNLERNSGLGDEAVQAWVQTRVHTVRLEVLNLSKCGLTAEACKALCSLRWPRLRVLALDECVLWGRGLEVLAAAGQQFPALNIVLGIWGTPFPPPKYAHCWPMLWH